MKIKGFFLISLILISTIGLSVTAFYSKDGMYMPYWGNVLDRPILSTVLTAAADGVYPWSPDEPVAKPQTTAQVEKENNINNNTSKHESTTNKPNAPKDDRKKFTTVDDSYFEDALFIGDSRMVGLSEYCEALDTRATFYAKKSLTIYDIRDKEWIQTEDGRKITTWEALEGQQFTKIYIMVGINEIGIGEPETFRDAYKEVVDAIMASQPNAIIYINSIMHVNKEKNDNDKLYNNTNIEARNEAIKQLADEKKIFYININEAVDDEEGNLNSEWTSDGVHLKGAYYEPWHLYLLSHAIV